MKKRMLSLFCALSLLLTLLPTSAFALEGEGGAELTEETEQTAPKTEPAEVPPRGGQRGNAER